LRELGEQLAEQLAELVRDFDPSVRDRRLSAA